MMVIGTQHPPSLWVVSRANPLPHSGNAEGGWPARLVCARATIFPRIKKCGVGPIVSCPDVHALQAKEPGSWRAWTSGHETLWRIRQERIKFSAPGGKF